MSSPRQASGALGSPAPGTRHRLRHPHLRGGALNQGARLPPSPLPDLRRKRAVRRSLLSPPRGPRTAGWVGGVHSSSRTGLASPRLSPGASLGAGHRATGGYRRSDGFPGREGVGTPGRVAGAGVLLPERTCGAASERRPSPLYLKTHSRTLHISSRLLFPKSRL